MDLLRKSNKVGLLGLGSSGKTMMILSILWNLRKCKYFSSSDAMGKIRDFKFLDDSEVWFNEKKDALLRGKDWPDKTSDTATVSCTYNLISNKDKKIHKRKLTLVDIPGERLADIAIYEAKDYTAWSDSVCRHFSKKHFDAFGDFLHDISSYDLDEAGIIRAYKKALLVNDRSFGAFMSPSTFMLNTNGEILQEQNCEPEISEILYERPIWKRINKQGQAECCDFCPLPKEMREKYPETAKAFEKRFDLYRKEVLKPVFDELFDCEHFICTVDILNILVSGRERLEQLSSFIGIFSEKIVPQWWSLNLKGRLRRKRLKYTPHIAYVATKCDTFFQYQQTQLEHLINELIDAESYQSIKLDNKGFVCAAYQAFECHSKNTEQALFTTKEENDCETPLNVTELPALPDTWDSDWSDWCKLWNHGDKALPRQDLKGGDFPPKNINLDKVLEYITEN